MALQDMLDYIQAEVLEEVQIRKNATRLDITKSLIDYSESCEKNQENKLYEFSEYLKKKELTLKAEQKLLKSAEVLSSENEFVNELLIEVKEILLSYYHQDNSLRENILTSCLRKSYDAVGDVYFYITSLESDGSTIKKIVEKLGIRAKIDYDASIEACFIINTEDGIVIDLSFKTLFNEKQHELLSIIMPILKENL